MDKRAAVSNGSARAGSNLRLELQCRREGRRQARSATGLRGGKQVADEAEAAKVVDVAGEGGDHSRGDVGMTRGEMLAETLFAGRDELLLSVQSQQASGQ